VQPGGDRAERGAHDLGRLAVAEALDVGQVEGSLEVRGEFAQCRGDLCGKNAVEYLVFRRARVAGGMPWCIGEAFDCAGQ